MVGIYIYIYICVNKQTKTNKMKDFITLTKELNQAHKNLVKMIKKNNLQAAEMWAVQIEKLEKELDNFTF